jgi:hypothetical protein
VPLRRLSRHKLPRRGRAAVQRDLGEFDIDGIGEAGDLIVVTAEQAD